MFQNRFDEFYLTICKEVGGIESFIKSFFDFLFRKTDFFYQCDPGDKMGFPPGHSAKLITGLFEQFQKEHYKKFPQKSISQFNKKLEIYKSNLQKKSPSNQSEKKITNTKITPQAITPLKQEEKAIPQKQIAPIINTYNGGTNEKYSWSQQSKEVEVTIDIDSGVTSKNISVELKNDSISIKKKTGQPIIEGTLSETICASESVWKIEHSGNKAFLVLNLEKAQDKIWSTVFKGDPQIDTSKVNNTKPLQEFDDQTQGAIRKIMYQQQRKQMGLPTTEQQKQTEALKKAWNAQGSPFKGTPFDPSKINLTGSDFHPD